jgi:formylglycine-generating enzyme required for sulfatase activity
MDILSDALQWAAASTAKQDEIVNILFSGLDGFEVAYENEYCLERPIRIISIGDVATKIMFNLIPGGTFTMGFSPEEDRVLRKIALEIQDDEPEAAQWVDNLLGRQNWHPAHKVEIAPFLLARFPLSWTQAELFDCLDEDNFLYQEYLDGSTFANAEVAHLSLSELERLLQNFKYTLPSESQWEYACRAGGTTLFAWGNDLRCPWLEDFTDTTANDAASNRFGLVNMGFHGDACADAWHDNYIGAPTNFERVLRGGAAFTYPWQGCGEWLSTLCAYRSTPDDFVNIRFALALPVNK